jgi:hypothetical protein
MIREKIYFWPQWFMAALPPRDRRLITHDLLRKLSRANLYLWRALNIYDDFLDGAGNPKKIPRANSYHRQYIEIYCRLNLANGFYRLFNHVNRGLDAANRREVAQPRLKMEDGNIILPSRLPDFPDLSVLSDKSLALGLGPIAILYSLKKSDATNQIKMTLDFFRQALAAKQLSDDARDWLDDLKSGAITAANAPILTEAKRKGLTLNLQRQPEMVYLLFVKNAANLSARLDNLCQAARQAWRRTGFSSDSPLLDSIIKPLETGLAETSHFRSLLRPNSQKML